MKKFSLIPLLLCLSYSISKAQLPDTTLTCCVVLGVELNEDVFVFPDIPGLGAYNVYFIDSVSGPNPYVFTMSDGDSVPVSIYSGYAELDTYHAYIGTNDTTFHYSLSDVKFIQRPRICLATVDSLQQIEIKLEYTANVGYDTVGIYRYVTMLNTVYAGVIDSSGLVLTDSDVNALTTSYKYEARVDGCPTSEAHQTIYLFQGTGPNGNNLQWTEYLGNEDDVIDGYTIWKFTDSLGFVSLTSVIGLNYTDLSGQPDDLYFVEATKVGGCADNPFAKVDENGGSIRSNYYSPNGVGLNEVTPIKVRMMNPSDGLHLTSTTKVKVTIYDMHGKTVGTYANTSSVDDTNLVNGTYVIHLDNGKSQSRQLLIVSK